MSGEKVKSSKTPWTAEEDAKLMSLISDPGTYGSWPRIAKQMENRTGKQCRERYLNQLNPGIKKGSWTKSEDETILRLHKELGNKWCKYTEHLPGRSDNSIKNRWHVISRADYVGNSVQSFITAKGQINEMLLKRTGSDVPTTGRQSAGIAASGSGSGGGGGGSGSGGRAARPSQRKKSHPTSAPRSSGNGSTTDSSSSGENSPAPVHLRHQMERISLDGRKKPPCKSSSAAVAHSFNFNDRDPLDDLCDMCNFPDMDPSASNQSGVQSGMSSYFDFHADSHLPPEPHQAPLSSRSVDSFSFSNGSSLTTGNKSTVRARNNGSRSSGYSMCSSIDSEDEAAPSQARFVIPAYQQQLFQPNQFTVPQADFLPPPPPVKQEQLMQQQQLQLQLQQHEIYSNPQHSGSYTTVASVNSTGTTGSASSGHSLFSHLSTGSFGMSGSQTASPSNQRQLEAIEEALSPNKFSEVADILNDEDVLEFFGNPDTFLASPVKPTQMQQQQQQQHQQQVQQQSDQLQSEQQVKQEPQLLPEPEPECDTYAVVALSSDEAVDAVLDALIHDMPSGDPEKTATSASAADRNSAQIAAAAVEFVEKMAAQVHDPASHSQSNLKKLLAYDSFTLKNGDTNGICSSLDASSMEIQDKSDVVVNPAQQDQQQMQPPRQSRKGKLASAVERPSLRPFSGSFDTTGNGLGLVERSPVAYTHLSPACPSTKRQCGFFGGSS